MTSQIRTHTEYVAHTLYSCARFVVEVDEKSSRNGGSDSGLLFWATLYIVSVGALNSTHLLTHDRISPLCLTEYNRL